MTKVRGNSEVKAMRRTFQPLLAATAGLGLLLSACSGESPTSPKPPTDGGGTGACTVTITLDATAVTPMAGTAVILRATVRKGGATVPDGTSVTFTTDFGFFLETGLPSVSKVTQNGFADVTLGATSSGLSKVKATFECGSAEKSIQYQPVPPNGPFISSIVPASGTCAGGDVVTINGGRFGTSAANLRVLFGGRPASLQTVTDTRIVVLTPSRTLANPQVPEVVDVVLQFFAGDLPTDNVTEARAFTYYCVDPNKRMTLTSIFPESGPPEGGQQVTISGNNFLPSATSSAATTRVTFGGAPASVVSVTNTSITVQTPRRILANPAVPETVDVTVTVDLGLVSQQTGLLPMAYTYRAGGGNGQCVGAPGLFIATVLPENPTNTGTPDGGDIVVISGGGFTAGGTSTTPDRAAVFFGGIRGVTLSLTDSQIRVSTPRRVLANPDRPESVDVRVIADAGGPREACVEARGAYTYFPGGYLEPVITSISPVVGPNDISTRVTIFGRNFQLPMQVFVRVGALVVEAAVVEIRANEIIFLTPTATGPNSGLAGQTVDVIVRDPRAGNDFVSPVRFRYYSCPSLEPGLNTVVPSSAPWHQSTIVTIAGQNFEEPVEVTFTYGSRVIRPSVTSVSSSLITLVMPPIDPGSGGSAACTNVSGTFTVAFVGVSCPPITLTNGFTYSVNPMTAVSATPTQLNQAGGPFGSPIAGPPATITVTGTNFYDPMTVVLIKDGSPVANTTVNNAIVANASQLSFTAPAITDDQLNTQNCVPAGGTSPTGTRRVPTSFGIRLTNTRTNCTVDLPNVLIYNPAEPACLSAMSVTGATPAAATLCTAYGPGNFAVTGGVPPYTFSFSNLPPGIVASPGGASVSVGGTPILPAAGPGQASTPYTGTLTVADSSAETANVVVPVSITVADPVAPFAVAAPAAVVIPDTGGSSGVFSATPNPLPAGFGSVSWTVVSVVPNPAPGTVTFSPATGQTSALAVSATVPADAYVVTVRATDAPSCGGPSHTVQLNYSFTKSPAP
jgi:hypothetical protein